MKTTATQAVRAYDETASAIEKAMAAQKKRVAAKEPFYGRVASEQGPLLDAMKLFLQGRDAEATGAEIIRVSQSLRRFQEDTYTSLASFPKHVRQQCYLNGLAAMLIVGGKTLGRGMPDPAVGDRT